PQGRGQVGGGGGEPAGRLEQHDGALLAGQGGQASPPLFALAGEEALEDEAPGGEAGDDEGGEDGAGAGDDLDQGAGGQGRSYEPLAGVGDAGHPSVGHIGDPGPSSDPVDQAGGHLRLVVGVEGHQAPRGGD